MRSRKELEEIKAMRQPVRGNRTSGRCASTLRYFRWVSPATGIQLNLIRAGLPRHQFFSLPVTRALASIFRIGPPNAAHTNNKPDFLYRLQLSADTKNGY
jgi:hypothetical protein